MFHRPGKKTKPSHAKPLKDLTAIALPEQLLADSKRQDLLQKIKENSDLDAARFTQFVEALAKNFAACCQSLPQTSNSYYALPGGMLDHALNRTDAALTLFREYVILDGEALSEEQKLWSYVLLSASILQGIGKLQIEYHVDLFDQNGQWLKKWNPLLENMSASGRYYHYKFQDEADDDLRSRLNLLLARHAMPSAGFTWIASHADALAVWLALLNEDWESAGTLGALLVRANAIAIQRYFSELVLKQAEAKGGRFGRISTFIDSTPDAAADKERLTGAQFIQWMINALERGTIMINKAPLYMVPGGLLMCADIFKLFIREHPEFKNWQAIQNSFLSLGLHQTNPEGGVISRFEQAQTQQMVSGVVFADFALGLPEKMQIHHLNTGKISPISAVELIHQAQHHQNFVLQQHRAQASPVQKLSADGQWETIEASAGNTAQPGVRTRG